MTIHVFCVRCRRPIVRYQGTWAPADEAAEFACSGVLTDERLDCKPGRVTNTLAPIPGSIMASEQATL